MVGRKHKGLAALEQGVMTKQLRAHAASVRIADRNAVFGKAVVIRNGVREQHTVRHWEEAPRWWNQATEEQRRLWVEAYFRRQLKLCEQDTLVSVMVEAR
jgi:hypothetical protein